MKPSSKDSSDLMLLGLTAEEWRLLAVAVQRAPASVYAGFYAERMEMKDKLSDIAKRIATETGREAQAKYPAPKEEGIYWARWIRCAKGTSDEEYFEPHNDFEPVDVFDNNGTGDDALRVFVLGFSRTQSLKDFEWGPRIPQFAKEK